MAGSDTSEDSMDSLENQKVPKIPSFLISEPCENRPSITKGIGRKTSAENEETKFTSSKMDTDQQPPQTGAAEEFFPRRNSDKSSCYSDDSLSNDSLSIGNQSPSSSSNTQSSNHFDSDIRNRRVNSYERMQLNQEISNAGTGNFQIFKDLKLALERDSSGELRTHVKEMDSPNSNNVSDSSDDFHKNSGSFELELSEMCSRLEATDILEMVRRTISDQIPPKLCVLKSASDEPSEKLSLEYEGGIQIELKIIDKRKDSKGIKMRRISGDHFVYNQLCQQLISCMTVS